MRKQQDKESRLDRIEKGLELLLQGTSELKESQRKTDEQQRKTDEQLKKTIKKLDEIGRQLGDLGLVQGPPLKTLSVLRAFAVPSFTTTQPPATLKTRSTPRKTL